MADNFEKLFDPANTATKPSMHVKTRKPIKDLYSYKGQLHFELDGESKIVNVDLNSFLHRGSFLENSGSVIALVIHTGTDTKMMMNMGKYKFKQSRFEKVLNGILIANLAMAIILAIINVILYRSWMIKMTNVPEKSFYLFQGIDKKGLGIKNFMSIYLIVNQFVPLDLLVVLEISKLVYTGLMESDV